MGFGVFNNNIDSNREFLDRTDILKHIEEVVIQYKESTEFYKLFAIYGFGGIGKSRLIMQIYELYRYTDLQVYLLPLEILNHETIPAILLHIRQKFSHTPHFDYALLQYWNFIGYDRVDRKQLLNISEKLLAKLSDKVDNALLLGLAGLENCICKLIEFCKEWGITEAEQIRIESLMRGKAEDWYTYMTQILAKDIESEIKNQKFVFLFDSYNIIQTDYKFDWLKYFINTFEQGIFFVTSREELEWFSNANVDNRKFESIPLNCIPEDTVLEYLLENGYSRQQAEIIMNKTECIPLFLDIAMTIGKKTVLDDQIFVGLKAKEDLVKYLLSHYSAEEQLVIEYLSVVNLFNQEIYDSALNFNRISPQIFCFSSFKKSIIVRYIEQFNDLYKIHSVLSNNISFFVEKDIRTKIIKDYLYCICSRILNDELFYDDIKYNFVLNAYKLIEDNPFYLDEDTTEKLIDMFFYLLDRSYGLDFVKDISLETNKENGCLKYIYQYIDGKITRGANIIKGLTILNGIPVNDCNFGRHQKSLQCDINYLLAISGKYNEAEKKMSDFVDQLQKDDLGQRYYTKGVIYNCDMKMLRGKFVSSVEELLCLMNQVTDQRMLFEINKAIGHNYRFNFLFENSMTYYSKLYDSSRHLEYYFTVLCETNCYFNPQMVFNIYKEAITENKKCNNYNNLGKIYYATAIADILERQYALAEKNIKKAYKEFKKTKYMAGYLFVMITEAYLEYSQTHNISSKTVKKIKNYLSTIDDIYEYLLLPIYVARKDIQKLDEFQNKFDWISYEKTIHNIKKFINLL